MADYDSNLIEPVQSLQNVSGLAPAKRRKERRRRRRLPGENAEYQESEIEEEMTEQENVEDTPERDEGGIDYCA